MSLFPASAYRENAARHLTSARQAIDNARRARRANCHELAVTCLNGAQHYRRAYMRRMRQARMAAQAEGYDALSRHWFEQAEAQPELDAGARYCYQLSALLADKATACYARVHATY